ncbi:hypothetical protein V8F44DRAFT_662560 [Aspergillus fumigatus]
MESFRLNITLFLAVSWLLFPNPSLSLSLLPSRRKYSTKHATCCGQGYACLSNLICTATESCTDHTWRSSACPLFCINLDPLNLNNLAGGQGIKKCPNTDLDMYYCIDYNMGNANYSAQQQVLIFKGTLAALTTIGVTATTEMTSSASMISSTTTGGPSPAATEPARKQTGVIAGAAVGGFLGLAAIIRLVYFFHRRRKTLRCERLGRTASSKLSSRDQGATALYEAPATENRRFELAG